MSNQTKMSAALSTSLIGRTIEVTGQAPVVLRNGEQAEATVMMTAQRGLNGQLTEITVETSTVLLTKDNPLQRTDISAHLNVLTAFHVNLLNQGVV